MKTGTVHYVLRDGEDKPVKDVSIQAYRDGRIAVGSFVPMKEAGVFEISYEPGSYRVGFRAPSEALLGETTVEVRESERTPVEMILRKR